MVGKAFSGKHSEATEKIIGAFYAVYNELGFGFSEKVYENALAITLRELELDVEQQAPITVYFADQHEAQLFNYLKATRLEVGLLLNFGPKDEFKRKVLTMIAKGHCLGLSDDLI